jgi:hypothetical protein
LEAGQLRATRSAWGHEARKYLAEKRKKTWFFIAKMGENINFDKTYPHNHGWKMQKFWNDKNVRKIRIESGIEGTPFSTTTKVWNNHKSSPRSTSLSAAICLMRF